MPLLLLLSRHLATQHNKTLQEYIRTWIGYINTLPLVQPGNISIHHLSCNIVAIMKHCNRVATWSLNVITNSYYVWYIWDIDETWNNTSPFCCLICFSLFNITLFCETIYFKENTKWADEKVYHYIINQYMTCDSSFMNSPLLITIFLPKSLTRFGSV